MRKKLGTIAVVAILTAITLTGCGGPSAEEKADIALCVEQMKTTLKEAGSDRELRQEEIDTCNDPKQRAFILGE